MRMNWPSSNGTTKQPSKGKGNPQWPQSSSSSFSSPFSMAGRLFCQIFVKSTFAALGSLFYGHRSLLTATQCSVASKLLLHSTHWPPVGETHKRATRSHKGAETMHNSLGTAGKDEDAAAVH